MKVLVTGATGAIGKKLVQSLLDKDFEVCYLTTDRNKLEGVFIDAKGFYWDPYKGQIQSQALDQVQIIVHLSGSSIAGSWSKSGKQQIIDSRVIPTTFLQQTLMQYPNKVQKVVCASAIGIYKDLPEFQQEDTHERAEGFLAEVVRSWEKQNLQFKQNNVEVVLLRIGLFLDRFSGALPKMSKPIELGLGSTLGSAKQYYSWIHHQDLVDMFIFAIEHNISGVYNAVSPSPNTNKEFTQILADVLGKRLVGFTVPAWVLRMILKQKSTLVLDGQKVSSQKIQQAGFTFKYPTLREALEQIYSK